MRLRTSHVFVPVGELRRYGDDLQVGLRLMRRQCGTRRDRHGLPVRPDDLGFDHLRFRLGLLAVYPEAADGFGRISDGSERRRHKPLARIGVNDPRLW
jgi:hypothetical protein